MDGGGLREIRLYGVLGKKFGRVHRLAVCSVREAMQALAVVVPGFAQHLLEHSRPGYQVFLDRARQRSVGEDRLEAPVSARELICVVPVVAGAKTAGMGQILLGAALIGLTLWNPLGAFSGEFAPFAGIGGFGAALVLGGVVQAISAHRTGSPSVADGNPSYAFNGITNNGQEGLPVPLRYGRVLCGGVPISQGIMTDDYVSATAPATLPTQTLPDHEPLDPINYSGGGEA